MQISAQISLYPLRQERLSPAIGEARKKWGQAIVIKYWFFSAFHER